MEGRCQTCRWWDTSAADAVDESLSPCRVHPPIIQVNTRRATWPMVDSEDWCGSHVQRPATPKTPSSSDCQHGFADIFDCPECRPF